MAHSDARWRWILPAILCNLLWGSAIPFINLGYAGFGIRAGETGSQLLFAGLRFFLAGVLTVAIRSVQKRRFVLPQRKNWGRVCILALFQTLLQYIFFYIGVANTLSVRASIIQGLNAFVSILIAAWVFRSESLNARKWIGGLIGVLGVVVVNLKGSAADLSWRFDGEGFLILSMISGAASAGLIKRFSQREDPVALSGWQFVLGGAVMTAVGFAAGGRLRPESAAAFAVLAYLALLSAVAYSVWSLLLKKHPVSRVAVFMFLQPVFGVLLGLLLVDQPLDIPVWQFCIALALICLCIVIVNRPERRSQR